MSRGDRSSTRDQSHPQNRAQERKDSSSQRQQTRSDRPQPVERGSAVRAFFTGGRFTSESGRVTVGFMGARIQAQNDKIANRIEVKHDGTDAGKRGLAELYGKHADAGARVTRDGQGQVSGVLLPYSVAQTERAAGTISAGGLQEGRSLARAQAREITADGRLGKDRIQSARDQIRGFKPQELRPATREGYERNLARMAAGERMPEQAAGTNKAFYSMRASALYGAKLAIKQGLQERAIAIKADDKAGALLAEDRIRSGLGIIDRYPPGTTKEENLARRDVITVAARESEHSNGKRDAIVGRPENWRDQVFDKLQPADRDAYAVMAATGARPAELRAGARCSQGAEGSVTVQLQGAKVDGERGYQERSITVSRGTLQESAAGRHLLAKLDEKGHAFVRAEGKGDAFSERVAYAGERAGFDEVSCYDLRHQFASDNKAADVDRGTLAQALGQRSERSQESYGRASSGSGGGISGASAS